MRHLRHDGEREDGFTLIELIVVMTIIGILLSLAVTSYVGFGDRARETKAETNIRSALPAVEAYYVDQDPNSYAGIGTGVLRSGYDRGLDAALTVRSEAGGTRFCIFEAAGNGTTYYFYGPGGKLSKDPATSGPPGSTPSCA